jgi:hypothetical protein
MAGYAAASSTTASFETIRDAASAGHERKSSRNATQAYRAALARVWVLDEGPAWIPEQQPPQRARPCAQAPARGPSARGPTAGRSGLDAVGGSELSLGRAVSRDGTLLGALFESLATLSVRVYAALSEARVKHLRTARGRQEVDLIVERVDGGVVAAEVKLARSVADADGKHLRWLRDKLGDRVLDLIIVTTGPEAYRRKDGIAVIPLALLGP